MDPKAPSQPSQQTSLEQSKNPIDQTFSELDTASIDASKSGPTMETRSVPARRSEEESNPTQTSMGYGERGPLKKRDISESDQQNYSNKGDLEGEQMRAPGEGDIADAVQGRGTNAGTGHAGQESLTQNMDLKKEAHEEELRKRGERTGKEIEEEAGEDWTGMRGKVDLNAALGRDGKDGEVTGVGETERGTGVVLAAENVSGTGGEDAREGLGDA
jgi:hypothetical protein